MISFKDAVRKMHKDPKAKFFFFFCEKGENNKPVMLADTTKIDPVKTDEAKEALAKAKVRAHASGTMHIADGTLALKPTGLKDGLTSSKLTHGVKIAAGNVQVQELIQGVVVGEPEKDTEEPPPEETEVEKLRKVIAQTQELLAGEADPKKQEALSVLLEKKENELVKLTGEPLPERVDRSIDEAQRKRNEHGYAPKSPSKEYEGEEKKLGWRARVGDPPVRDEKESDTDFARRQQAYQRQVALANSEMEVTKHYTDEERQRAQVNVDEQGRLRDSTGKLLKESTSGYVTDTGGQMHQFKEGTFRETGKSVDDLKQGGMTRQVEWEHHTSPLAGQESSGAGRVITSKRGLVERITNKSGHYKPGVAQMIQTVETLLKNGALLDKEWVDSEGQPLKGKALELYEGVMMLQDEIMEKLTENKGTDISQHLQAVDKAKKMLAKLGCGPSNRYSKAVVEFFDAKEGMTGAEVVTGTTTEHRVGDFVSSGAGYVSVPKELRDQKDRLLEQLDALAREKGDTKDRRETLEKELKDLEAEIARVGVNQQQAKGKMMEELLEKTAGQRKDLKEHTLKGFGSEGPSKDDMKELVGQLVALTTNLNHEALFETKEMPEQFAELMLDFRGRKLTAREIAKRTGDDLEDIWRNIKSNLGLDKSQKKVKFKGSDLKDPFKQKTKDQDNDEDDDDIEEKPWEEHNQVSLTDSSAALLGVKMRAYPKARELAEELGVSIPVLQRRYALAQNAWQDETQVSLTDELAKGLGVAERAYPKAKELAEELNISVLELQKRCIVLEA